MTRAANLMKSLIEDLLELSRLERLEELTREHVDLETVIQTSINSIKPFAQSKKIELVLNETRSGLIVEGSMVLLSRAVGNLIDNAIKYTQAGGKIHIKLSQNHNQQATIAVVDNGPGISTKDLPRVFEKFYRARPELDDIPGTGLGLAIVKTIAEQHSGQVWVESQPNVGSTFTISLPLCNEK
jgi:two-component system phosphate regulon sensor histidine kinase PhoR